VKWTNSSGVIPNDFKQVLQYDFSSNLLKFEFHNFASLLALNGPHDIKITLKDEKGKANNYPFIVRFNLKLDIVKIVGPIVVEVI
jgi:hypothetical protein